MSQQINDNFQLLAGLPLDDRTRKSTITERDAIPATRRFQGLQCFVQQTQTLYQLQGGITNSNWVGIAGVNASSELETVIEGFYVLSAGKETLFDWEIGDKFRGWIGNRYVVGEIVSLPVSLPSDIDNVVKVILAIDSDELQNIEKNKTFRNSIEYKGKQIHWFGDSYTEGTGASTTDNRFTSIVSRALGTTEVNHGVAGTTMEKRAPIDYMASPNMVDNVVNIPTKTTSMSMLVFAFGLNDMGQTASAYNTTNFKTDYQFVLDNALSKGWDSSEILLIPAYYIGSAGYAEYATITGNPAPTQARHLAFIQATKEISEDNETMYFDIYQDQLKNNTTLLDPDNIHANDAGHAYIANDVLQYLGQDKIIAKGNTTWDFLPGFYQVLNKLNTFVNGLLFDDGEKVGLGTILPQAGFHINSIVNSVKQKFTNSVTGANATDGVDLELDSSANFLIKNLENGNVEIWSNNTKRFTVLANGRILVNTSTDNTIDQFQVNGTGIFTGTTNTPLSARSTVQSYLKSISGGTGFDAAFYSFDGTNAVAMGLLASSGITPGNFGVFSNGTAQMDVGAGGFKIPTLTGATTVKALLGSDGKIIRGATEPLKYVAIISQSGTSNPTVTVLENTLGGTLVWTRSTTGIYLATLTGAFPVSKTAYLYTSGYNGTAELYSVFRSSANDITLTARTAGTGAYVDSAITNSTIEIRVYP